MAETSSPILLVGLGNPGPDYAGTRHNVGMMLAEQLADHYHFSASRKKFHGLLREGEVEGVKCLVLCPQTYMNRSGLSVGGAASFYKIPSDRILVCYDELDLPQGRAKLKQGGGAGGHNGIRDIDTAIPKDYWRLRIGIGHPGRKEMVTGFVLSRFHQGELDELAPVLETCIDGVPAFINEGGKALQERLHTAFPATSNNT